MGRIGIVWEGSGWFRRVWEGLGRIGMVWEGSGWFRRVWVMVEPEEVKVVWKKTKDVS